MTDDERDGPIGHDYKQEHEIDMAIEAREERERDEEAEDDTPYPAAEDERDCDGCEDGNYGCPDCPGEFPRGLPGTW